MLTIDHARHAKRRHIIVAIVMAIVLIALSVYITALYFAPALSLGLYKKPFALQSVPAPNDTVDRLIVPKIGLDITYTKSPNPSKQIAEWHQVQTDTPKDGNNVVLAAYRFNLELTPAATIDASPFYNIDKLAAGDKVFVDYQGTRYAYDVQQSAVQTSALPSIDATVTNPTLTLYTLGEGQKCYVVTATKLGQVQL